MISTREIFDIVQTLAQKQKHGTITISEFEKFANMASGDLFNERIGSIRDLYKLGKGIPKVAPGMNKQVDEALSPFFVKDAPVALVAGVGTVTGSELIDTVTLNGVPVKWVPHFKVGSYLRSTIDFPTVDYPIYEDNDVVVNDVSISGLAVYPKTATQVLVSYYRFPRAIKYNYTVDPVKRRPVFNPTGTIDFEWRPTEKLQLVFRICKYIGLSIRDNELMQVAEQEKINIA